MGFNRRYYGLFRRGSELSQMSLPSDGKSQLTMVAHNQALYPWAACSPCCSSQPHHLKIPFCILHGPIGTHVEHAKSLRIWRDWRFFVLGTWHGSAVPHRSDLYHYILLFVTSPCTFLCTKQVLDQIALVKQMLSLSTYPYGPPF